MAARGSYDSDRKSDEVDFQSLVDLHYATLYRFATGLTRTESDACDLVQRPDMASSLDAQDARQWLSQMGEQFQAAVALFYLKDYSCKEIADILEIPLGTVKSRIAHGLARLKELVLGKTSLTDKAKKGGAA